jgi:hypothetical protein
MMNNYQPTQCDSDFLAARPSFLQGLSAAIDIGGTLTEYNTSQTPQEADARAIASDWAITGRDIHIAIQRVRKQR